MSSAQIAAAGLIAVSALALAIANPPLLAACLSVGAWAIFLASIALRSMAAVADGATPKPRMLSDHELPVYTIVAALYRESEVVEDLVKAFDALDYPMSKLDIKLVVELRDRETLSRILELKLPARYEVIVAPPGEPSTKPRALDIALAAAGRASHRLRRRRRALARSAQARGVAIRIRARSRLPSGAAYSQEYE